MTAPREPSLMTLFIQISLAIHVSPSAQPERNRSNSQMETRGHTGMTSKMSAAMRTPKTMQRLNPRRPMRRGYKGPSRITATRLAAVTAPMAKLEVSERLKMKAIKGGWKPKINPTPRLLEKTAPRARRCETGETLNSRARWKVGAQEPRAEVQASMLRDCSCICVVGTKYALASSKRLYDWVI